jgi:hypothetical protein
MEIQILPILPLITACAVSMEMSGVDAPAERLRIYEHVCTASSRAYT